MRLLKLNNSRLCEGPLWLIMGGICQLLLPRPFAGDKAAGPGDEALRKRQQTFQRGPRLISEWGFSHVWVC